MPEPTGNAAFDAYKAADVRPALVSAVCRDRVGSGLSPLVLPLLHFDGHKIGPGSEYHCVRLDPP